MLTWLDHNKCFQIAPPASFVHCHQTLQQMHHHFQLVHHPMVAHRYSNITTKSFITFISPIVTPTKNTSPLRVAIPVLKYITWIYTPSNNYPISSSVLPNCCTHVLIPLGSNLATNTSLSSVAFAWLSRLPLLTPTTNIFPLSSTVTSLAVSVWLLAMRTVH
jgi:hypothetical protein